MNFYAKQGTLAAARRGVYDNTNAAWIVNPASGVYSLTGTLEIQTLSFVVPDTCDSVTIYPAWEESLAGTMYLGQVQTRLASSSTTYIPSYEKQAYFYDEGFVISANGTTVPANVDINTPIQLPVPLLINPSSLNLILPSNVELIQSDGTVLATDDGAGNIYGGTIDYTTGLIIIPILPDGDYHIRYLQNTDQNFDATQNQTFTYSLPKDNYADTTELLSTIEVIS